MRTPESAAATIHLRLDICRTAFVMAVIALLCGSYEIANAQGGAFAGGGSGGAVTATRASLLPERVGAGGKTELRITLTVSPGFHINANRPGEETLIPTEFTPAAINKGLSFGKPIYPSPKTIKVEYSKTPLKVYEGSVTIRVPVTVTRNARPGTIKVGGTVRFQGCNETSCFPPTRVPVSAALIVNGVK